MKNELGMALQKVTKHVHLYDALAIVHACMLTGFIPYDTISRGVWPH